MIGTQIRPDYIQDLSPIGSVINGSILQQLKELGAIGSHIQPYI
jgi:hypothetical protein